MQWKFYYADGSTFDDTQGLPQDAPSLGVIAIKHFIEGEWRLQAFADYYIWEGEWWGADQSGFWQYLFKPGLKVVKFGTNIKDEPFQKIMAVARADTGGGMPVIA